MAYMPTREELHKLIESMPNGAMEAAHGVLSNLQIWPPVPPPDVQEMRKRMQERRLELRQRQTPGTIAVFGGNRHYDSAKGSGSFGLNYWDGDSYVQETLRHHKGHELTVIERIRVDGQHLMYKHEITGPGEKHDEREITFELS
jgi:hypothetical protein